MTENFISGTRPYSEAERARDAADSRRALQLQVGRHKATPSGQRYNTRSTPAARRNINRMVASE